MKKIGILFGQEKTFPQAFIEAVNAKKEKNITAEAVYIDKTGLEDAIAFQEIEFEILDGYYFNEGHTSTIQGAIRHLYSLRRELKKTKNPEMSLLTFLI